MDIHLDTDLKIHNMTKEEYNVLPETLKRQVRCTGKSINYVIMYPSGLPNEIKQWLRRQGVII